MSGEKSILIIDDSNTNVVLLEAILETKGFTTFSALSVKEALPLLRSHKPNLILLDLLMPEISGFDFLSQVQEKEELKGIPIVVVSALNDEENIEKTLGLGAIEFIKKPVDIQTLVNTVEKVFEN